LVQTGCFRKGSLKKASWARRSFTCQRAAMMPSFMCHGSPAFSGGMSLAVTKAPVIVRLSVFDTWSEPPGRLPTTTLPET
jgi:hypothetical protein